MKRKRFPWLLFQKDLDWISNPIGLNLERIRLRFRKILINYSTLGMDYKLIWNEFRNHFGFWILEWNSKKSKGEEFIGNMTFEGLWLLSPWTFHWWGNCNQGLLCDSSLWVSFLSCSPRRLWAFPATSARWPSAVCQTKVYWLGNFTRHVRSETEQETSIEICSYSFMSGVSGMPGVSLFMFSPKLLLEPIEDLIVLELMVVQDIVS